MDYPPPIRRRTRYRALTDRHALLWPTLPTNACHADALPTGVAILALRKRREVSTLDLLASGIAPDTSTLM